MAQVPRPGVGQISIPEMEVPIERHLDSLNAFARMATPDYWSLKAEDYSDIGEREIAAASVGKFRSLILDVPIGTNGAVIDYIPGEDTIQSRRVVLNSREYGIIVKPLSPRKVGEAAVNKAFTSRATDPDFGNRVQTSKRAGLHSIETLVPKMQKYLSESLQPEGKRLEKLQEAAMHPGLSRGKELGMRMLAASFLEFDVKNILEVCGKQREWTKEQSELANRAVMTRLFFVDDKNVHITYWRDMINLALDYNAARQGAFADRISRHGAYITEHAKQY